METAHEPDRRTPEEAAAIPQHVPEVLHSSPQGNGAQTDEQMHAAFSDGQARLESREDARTTRVLPDLPTITLSVPSPPPLYDQLFPPQGPTEQMLARQASPETPSETSDQRGQEADHAHHTTPGNPPPDVCHPPFQIVPRPQEDVDEMFEAMQTGIFDTPIFGEAGAVYHDKLTARLMPRTPMYQHYNIIPEVPQPRPAAAPNDRLQTPNTPTPKPKTKRKPRKRKRDQTPQETVIKGEDKVQAEPLEKKHKVVKVDDTM